MNKMVIFAAFATFTLGIVTGQTMTIRVPAAVQPVAQTMSPLDMMHAAHGLTVQAADNTF